MNIIWCSKNLFDLSAKFPRSTIESDNWRTLSGDFFYSLLLDLISIKVNERLLLKCFQ